MVFQSYTFVWKYDILINLQRRFPTVVRGIRSLMKYEHLKLYLSIYTSTKLVMSRFKLIKTLYICKRSNGNFEYIVIDEFGGSILSCYCFSKIISFILNLSKLIYNLSISR